MILKKNKLAIAEPEPGSKYGPKEMYIAIREVLKYTTYNKFNYKNQITEFEKKFAEYIGVHYAVAVSGGGVAMDMILKSLDLSSDDEIISSAISFPGTHLSILNSGAKMILCNCNETLNISPDSLKSVITSNTRAVVITHMNGLSCNMNKIMEVIDEQEKKFNIKIKLIADSARTCGGKYNEKKTGSFEWATIFSFQRKKQITTLGEGGMIVTNDYNLYQQLLCMRSFGNGIQWGTNYKLTNIQAAIGICQLKKLNCLNNKRRKIAHKRTNTLKKYLPDFVYPQDNFMYYNTYYLYTLLVPDNWSEKMRDELIAELKNSYNIGCCVGNDVSYKKNAYIRARIHPYNLENSEKIGARVICIIIHPHLTYFQQKYINKSFIEAVTKIRKQL